MKKTLCFNSRMSDERMWAEDLDDLSFDNRTFDHNIDSDHRSTGDNQLQSIDTADALSSAVQTVDGRVIESCSLGNENSRFLRIQTRHTQEEGAYFVNVLPVPALDCYATTPEPSTKIGKYIKHPEFRTLTKRLESFLNYRWPREKPSAYALGTAGMFYRGMILLFFSFLAMSFIHQKSRRTRCDHLLCK